MDFDTTFEQSEEKTELSSKIHNILWVNSLVFLYRYAEVNSGTE